LIYLDSCAVVKLLQDEQYSAELHVYVSHVRERPISSRLTRIEVSRTLRRTSCAEEVRTRANQLLDRLAILPIEPCVNPAAELPHRHLRSLDALHLATALGLGRALSQFVTYDRQLGKAAEEVGLPVLAPGA
jgi:predicted nucleic acid-binding protein